MASTTTGIYELLTGSSTPFLASGDCVCFVDISDTSQAPQGSLVKGTLTQFFAAVPVPVNITSTSAVSLAVGRQGSTQPAFAVDASTALQVAGLLVTGAVTGGTVAVAVTDSGSNANLSINAKGSGTIGIGSVSTGRVTITPVTTITGALTLGDRIGVLGSAPDLGQAVFIQGSLGGNVNGNGVYSGATFASDVTTSAACLAAAFRTAAAVFTITTGRGIFVATPSLGAGSVVTTMVGLDMGNITGGGTNYAIRTALGLVSFGDATSVNSTLTVTSTSANAFAVGPVGATNPTLQIDGSTSSAATGLKVKSAAAAAGLALSVISSGTNENLTIDGKGSGTIALGNTSTGAITLVRATTISAALTYGGVTLSNSVTGTGSMVLSASPTLTGTTTLATLQLANSNTLVGSVAGATALLTWTGSNTTAAFQQFKDSGGTTKGGIGWGSVASGTMSLEDASGSDVIAWAASNKLGFYGTAPISRQVLATGTGKTVDNVITALQNLGLVSQT